MKFSRMGFRKWIGENETHRISATGVLVIVQILLLSICIIRYAIPLHSYTYQGQDLTAAVCRHTAYKEYGEGCYVDMDLIAETAVDPQYVYITTPPIDLTKGSYQVSVVYQTDDPNQKYAFTSALRTAAVIVGNDGRRIPVDADKIERTFSSQMPVEAFEVHLNYSGKGYLFVESITIRETNAWKNVRLFWVLLGCFLINGFLWWYRRVPEVSRRRARVTVVMLTGIALFASLPLMRYLMFIGDDLSFHLSRIEAIKTSLLKGEIPNRMSGYWNNGYGYASAIFYGEIFLYIPALLRILGFSVQGAYKMYVVLINLLTAYVSYYSFRKVFRDHKTALIGSAAYVLMPYRFVCMYTRAAVGEYTAMLFFPLIFYGLMRIYMDSAENERYGMSWVPLALGMTGIIQSHVITCVIVVLFIGLFCLILIKKTFTRPCFVQMLKAVLGTVLINLWFLIPFADYMRLGYAGHETSLSALGRMGSVGAYLSQMFTLFQTGWGYTHASGVFTNMSERNYALGAFALAAAFYLIYRLYQGKMQTEIVKIGDFSLALAVLSGFMCTIWFPWDSLQQMNGLFRMITKNIQFSWRYMGVCCFFLTLTTMSLFCLLARESSGHRYRMCLIVLGAFFFVSADHYMYDFAQKSEVLELCDESDLHSEEVGNGEYLPRETPVGYVYEAVSVPGSGVEVIEEQRIGREHRVICKNNAQEESCIDLPILPYKGYVCRDQETGEKLSIQLSLPGRLRVLLPQGYDGTLYVRFEEPWYWRGAELVSAVTLIGIVLQMILQKKARMRDIVRE